MSLSGASNNIVVSVIILFAVSMAVFLLKNRSVDTEVTPITKSYMHNIKTPASAKQVSNVFESISRIERNTGNLHEANKVVNQAPLISVLGINPTATQVKLKSGNGMMSEYLVGEEVMPDIFVQRIESTQVVFSQHGDIFIVRLSGRNQWPSKRPLFIDGVAADGATSIPLPPKDGHQFGQISSDYQLPEGVSADGSMVEQTDSVTAEGATSIPHALKDDSQFVQISSDYQLPEGVSADGSMVGQSTLTEDENAFNDDNYLLQ